MVFLTAHCSPDESPCRKFGHHDPTDIKHTDMGKGKLRGTVSRIKRTHMDHLQKAAEGESGGSPEEGE